MIAAAQDYNIQTLAVAQDFSQPGMVCPQCGMPHIEEKTCVCCGESLVDVADIVYDLVEEAARQGATVRHVGGENLIASLGIIAAVIKFKKGDIVQVEEAAETEA